MSRCPQCGMKDCCGGDFVAELEAAHTEIERLQRLRDENEALKDLIAGAADELGDFPPSERWVDQFVKRAEAALAANGE